MPGIPRPARREPATAARRPRTGALRLHGTIARKLGILIVSGRYLPGEVLGGEIAASEQHHVSRTAYREAVRILAAKGLVNSRPKVGTRINRQSEWHLLDPDVLEWMFDSEPDLALLDSLFELRNVVESAAAALAAQRRTAAHVRTMESALEKMAAHTLAAEAGRQADLEFHRALLDATGNPFFISLTDSVAAAIHATTVFKQRRAPLRRDPMPAHLRVFRAIAARDPAEAQQAMSSLIKLARIDTPAQRPAGRRRARK